MVVSEHAVLTHFGSVTALSYAIIHGTAKLTRNGR